MKRRSLEKRDANEPAIVQALEAAGRSVELLPGGGGRPDLLVGWGRSHVVLLEVKTEEGALEPAQVDWHRRWRGPPVVVVKTVAEALRAAGVPIADRIGACHQPTCARSPTASKPRASSSPPTGTPTLPR